MTPERQEAAFLLRSLGRGPEVISANLNELSLSEAKEFCRTGKLPARHTQRRQLRLFGTEQRPEMTETPSGGKPLGPHMAFAKPPKEPTPPK